jgi:hypothetical protein
VALAIRASGSQKSRGVTVSVDGKRAGVTPLNTRVKPGTREIRFTDLDADIDLKCTIEVSPTGRTMEFDAKKLVCPAK